MDALLATVCGMYFVVVRIIIIGFIGIASINTIDIGRLVSIDHESFALPLSEDMLYCDVHCAYRCIHQFGNNS